MKSPWPLRVLALAGLAISAYLLSQKLLGRIDSIVGCGGGSGCANVLGSRWSQFFTVPVTAFSTLLYAILFCVTLTPRQALRPLRAALAICFTGAALWFFGVLIFELKAFCPWCTAAHVIGLASALLLGLSLRSIPAEERRGNAHFGIVGGALAVFVLILGQIFGPVPPTHLETTGGSMEQEDQTASVHARPQERSNTGSGAKGRVVAVFDDDKFYNTATLPHLGPAGAPHVVVKYFDYTCRSCKNMDEDLEKVTAKHPGKFCVIMLPVPLNRDCNPHFPEPMTNHTYACELARLSLAAWRADPESWPELHKTLFEFPAGTLELPELAREAANAMIGEEPIAKALEDPWVEEMITANSNDFRQLIAETPKMPKLLVGKGRMLHGLTSSPEVLMQNLEQEFGLVSAP